MNGEMRGLNNTLETINAAANAIASAGNRLPQSSYVQVYIYLFCVFVIVFDLLFVVKL